MASIKKEGDTWLFVIDLPRDPITNKRRQKKRRGFKTKKEAQIAAAELLHELTKGTHVEETDMSFESYVDFFVKDYSRVSGKKMGTIRLRTFQAKVFLNYFRSIKVKDITRKMYQDVLINLKDAGYSDNHISGIHVAGRMMFKRAMELEYIKSNPTDYAKLPKTKVTIEDLEQAADLPKYMEKEELAHFLNVVREYGLDGDYEAFLTLAYTGMRIGEFACLKETDIDFEENTISITKTYYNERNIITDYQLVPPKTKKSKRTIDVEQFVIDVLKSLIAKNREFKMLHRKTYHDKGFLIINKEDYPGYPKSLRRYGERMKRLMKIAGLNEKLTPHSLRHTHTSLLAEAGVPIQDIMDRLGHQDDSTTKRIYLHVTKEKKKEASSKFAELMEKHINLS